MKLRTFVGSAAVAGIVLAGMSKQGGMGAGGTPQEASVGAIPATGSYTPASWASAFLGVIGEPQTACNQSAVEAWENAEGGAWDNSAAANPLDTTEREPGSWSINSVGVQAYPSWAEGLQANAAAITNGLYGGILSALSAGDSAQAVADAVASSPWGTAPFEAAC